MALREGHIFYSQNPNHQRAVKAWPQLPRQAPYHRHPEVSRGEVSVTAQRVKGGILYRIELPGYSTYQSTIGEYTDFRVLITDTGEARHLNASSYARGSTSQQQASSSLGESPSSQNGTTVQWAQAERIAFAFEKLRLQDEKTFPKT